MPMTDTDVRMLNDASTEDEWNTACTVIKKAHGGDYPEDWYMNVIAGGLTHEFVRRAGAKKAKGTV